MYATSKSYKCTLCYGRAGAGADLNAAAGPALPTKATDAEVLAVPQKAHQPSCVYTCPAKAMSWDTKTNILAYIGAAANGFISAQGDGSVYWASRRSLLIAPKADPFVEDHVTPLMSSLVSGPFAKAALVPTLLAGGLVAVIARRQRIADESVGEV
jgi:hypothetical protein